jgi:hypothetical protein
VVAVKTKENVVRPAAISVAVGFAGLAVFQLALAAGAPLGAAAWGGTQRVVPNGLRIGSAIAAVLYVVGAFAVLRCAGYELRWMPFQFARIATWVFGVILPLSAVANFASESEWERYLLAPIGLLLGVGCLAITRYSRTPADAVVTAEPARGTADQKPLASSTGRPSRERT